MSCMNDHDFLDPASRARSVAVARRGIIAPQEIKLRPGQILFRFGHSSASYDQTVGGLWWMTDATFHHVMRTAQTISPNMRPDRAVRDLYRQKLAVPGRFGPSDMVVRAVVAGPLRAWTGRGKAVGGGSGEQSTFVGAFEVAQLCIPGLMVETLPGSRRWVRVPNYAELLRNEAVRAASTYFT